MELGQLARSIDQFQAELNSVTDIEERQERQKMIDEMREELADAAEEVNDIRKQRGDDVEANADPHFGADTESMSQRVELALEYWRRERARAEEDADDDIAESEYTEEEEANLEALETDPSKEEIPDAVEEIWGEGEGVLCGFGKITFTDGTVYEGYWENLRPSGDGSAVFRVPTLTLYAFFVPLPFFCFLPLLSLSLSFSLSLFFS